MGWSTGSVDASDDMKRCAALVLALLIAGCSHTSVMVSSGGSTTTSYGSASVGISGGGSSVAWALIGIGLIAAELAGRRAGESTQPAVASQPSRALDQRRNVNEQDCSQPIKDWSANLKCK